MDETLADTRSRYADPNAYMDTDVPGSLDQRDFDNTEKRVALGPRTRTVGQAVVNRDRALGMDLIINEAGRYLVLRAIRSHFLDPHPGANDGMFGFVTAR